MIENLLIAKPLEEAEKMLEMHNFPYELQEVLSPKEDKIGTDKRVIKVEKKEKLIIYYSLF